MQRFISIEMESRGADCSVASRFPLVDAKDPFVPGCSLLSCRACKYATLPFLAAPALAICLRFIRDSVFIRTNSIDSFIIHIRLNKMGLKIQFHKSSIVQAKIFKMFSLADKNLISSANNSGEVVLLVCKSSCFLYCERWVIAGRNGEGLVLFYLANFHTTAERKAAGTNRRARGVC